MSTLWSSVIRLGRQAYTVAARAVQRPFLLRQIPALTTIDSKRPVYVFFSPEAAIRPHYVAQAIIARTLKELGHQVLMVHCEGEYPHCIAMDTAGLGLEKTMRQRNSVCRSCDNSWLQTTASYCLPSISLAELITPGERAQIHKTVSTLPDDAGTFEFDGFRFGALCGADLALTMKTLDQMRATGRAREKLKAYIEGTLISYQVMRKLLTQFNVARLIFFNEYSMLMGAAVAAMRAQVPITRTSHAVFRNIDRTKIMLESDPLAIITYHKLLDNWQNWRDLALPAEVITGITDSALLRLGAGGHTVYSQSHSRATDKIFETLGLSKDRRTLVAYTSSMDEYHSNISLMGALGNVLFQKEQPFESQSSWLRALVQYVEESDHLQLVLRIHPREGVNSHESYQSDNLKVLKDAFSDPFKNVHIIWPEDKTSSYDLAEIADLALTGWSNITLELARLGIPILTAFKRYVPFPVGDVVAWEPTAKEYFATLEGMLSAKGNIEHIQFAYRWSNVYSLSLSLDFDDLVPAPNFNDLPPYKIPRVAPLVESILVQGASVTEINRQTLEATQHADSVANELDALRKELRRVIWFLATGEMRVTDYTLAVSPAFNDISADLVVTIEKTCVLARTRKETHRRRSNIIARLAPLAAQLTAARQSELII